MGVVPVWPLTARRRRQKAYSRLEDNGHRLRLVPVEDVSFCCARVRWPSFLFLRVSSISQMCRLQCRERRQSLANSVEKSVRPHQDAQVFFEPDVQHGQQTRCVLETGTNHVRYGLQEEFEGSMPGVLVAASSKPLKQSVIILFPTSFWHLPRVLEGPCFGHRLSRRCASSVSTHVLLTECLAESRENDVHRSKMQTLFFFFSIPCFSASRMRQTQVENLSQSDKTNISNTLFINNANARTRAPTGYGRGPQPVHTNVVSWSSIARSFYIVYVRGRDECPCWCGSGDSPATPCPLSLLSHRVWSWWSPLYHRTDYVASPCACCDCRDG